jgi:hypothetical protein
MNIKMNSTARQRRHRGSERREQRSELSFFGETSRPIDDPASVEM